MDEDGRTLSLYDTELSGEQTVQALVIRLRRQQARPRVDPETEALLRFLLTKRDEDT